MISKKFFIFILLLLSGIVNSSSESIEKKRRYDKLKIKNTTIPKSGKTISEDYDQEKISEADAKKNSEKDAAIKALVAKYEELEKEITDIEKEIKELKPSKPKKKKRYVIEKIANVYDMFMNMLNNDSKNQDASIQGNQKRLQSDIKSRENKRNSLKAKLDQIKLEIAKKNENEEKKKLKIQKSEENTQKKNLLIAMAKEKADTDKAKAEQEKVRKAAANAAPKKTTAKKYEDHSKQETNILFPEIRQILAKTVTVMSVKSNEEKKQPAGKTISPKNVKFDGEELTRPTTAAAAAAKKYVVNEEKLQSQSKHRTVITAKNKDSKQTSGNNVLDFDDAAGTQMIMQNDKKTKGKSK